MIYAIICVVLIVILGILSAGRTGRQWVVIDVGLCALFGTSYTSRGVTMPICPLKRWFHCVGNQSCKHAFESALDRDL